MKAIRFSITACVISFLFCVACTKPVNDPSPDVPKPTEDPAFAGLPKIDSMSTWSSYVLEDDCNPFSPPRLAQKYKFVYDTTGRIAQLTVYNTLHSNQPYIYKFGYDNKKRISSIYYRSSPAETRYDSIFFTYVSDKVTEAYNHVAKIGGSATFIRSRFYQSDDSISIIVTASPLPTTNTIPIVTATLLRDDSANIKSITYFRGGPYFTPTDTAMTIENNYNTDIPNPYYGIYKRLNIPLFFLLTFSDLYGNIEVLDLSQALSRHCISGTMKKTYNNVYCVGTPGIVTQNYEYPDYVFFKDSDNRLIEFPDTPSSYYNRTYTGYINGNATFSYK